MSSEYLAVLETRLRFIGVKSARLGKRVGRGELSAECASRQYDELRAEANEIKAALGSHDRSQRLPPSWYIPAAPG